MLPTPETPGLPDSIYPPSEDSYLLLDALSDPIQISFLTERLKNTTCPLVADLGTGSGVILALVLAHAKLLLGRSDVLGLGVDINRDACFYSRNTVLANCKEHGSQATYLTTINSSLLAGLRPRQIDLLIFNPPYVPTPDVPTAMTPEAGPFQGKLAAHDRDSHLLSLSYSGGKDGLEVTNKLLEDLPNCLSQRGIAYVLLCKANKVEEIIKRILAWPKSEDTEWKAEVVRSSGKQAGWERLVVLRIWRS